MKFSKEQLRLYLVTDRTWLLPGERLTDRVEKALRAGVTMVQLREKNLSYTEFVKEAQEMKALCASYQVPLLINDRVDVAKAVDADGVHVGLEDLAVKEARQALGPGKIIGASAHNPQEARQAWEAGASYLGCGAVFGTATKADVIPLELPVLAQICRQVPIPVAAIGGITPDNAHQLKGVGIQGIAVISAIMAKEEPGQAVSALLETVRKITETGCRITVNGQTRRLLGQMTVEALLKEMGYCTARVAVERNGAIVPRASFSQVLLQEGDSLEVVSFVGGG